MSRWSTIVDTKPKTRAFASGKQTTPDLASMIQSPNATMWGSKAPYIYMVNGQPISQNAKIPFSTKATVAVESRKVKQEAAAVKKQTVADAKAEYKAALAAAKASGNKAAIQKAKQDFRDAKAMAVATYKDTARGANQAAASKLTGAKAEQVVANQKNTNLNNQAMQGGASTSGQYGLPEGTDTTGVQPLYSGLSDPLQSPAYFNPDRSKSYDQNVQDAITLFSQQGKMPNPASDPGLYQAVNQFAIGQQSNTLGGAASPSAPPTQNAPAQGNAPQQEQIGSPDINSLLSMLTQYFGGMGGGAPAQAAAPTQSTSPAQNPYAQPGGSNNFMQALEMQRQRILAQNAGTPGFAAGGYLDQNNPPAPAYNAPSFAPSQPASNPQQPQNMVSPNLAPYTQYTHNPGVTSDISRGDDGQTGGVPVPGQTNPLW